MPAKRLLPTGFICAFLIACGGGNSGNTPEGGTPTPTPSVAIEGLIRLNQLGYHSQAPKLALVPGAASGDFEVVSTVDNSVVYTGSLSAAEVWQPSGERLRRADFSSLTSAGQFKLRVDGVADSHPFNIGGPEIYADLHDATIKAYYFNRASTELLAEHAGPFARAAGHPDDNVLVHASAADADNPAGSALSAPKGWYDAGDYNKYIVNSGISTYTLLMAYAHYPQAYSRELNIPESGNALPDILDEVLWNLDWMLAMQDSDGGVYHKLTTLRFSGEQMPSAATEPRYVVKKSTAAALDFAATLAAAVRVLEPFAAQLPTGKLAQMESASIAAWDWAQANPEVLYSQADADLSDVHTGEYGDWRLDDEFAWAAAELFLTTEDEKYKQAFITADMAIDVPGWQNVQGLAYMSLANEGQSLVSTEEFNQIAGQVRTLADTIVSDYQASVVRVAMNTEDFFWGSNSQALNKAMMLLQAYRLTPQSTYLDAAYALLDYVLGRNVTDYSMVTGFGERSPMAPHHRVSEADNVAAPIPGFVVGGPQPGQQDECTYPADEPARSYLDSWCSYSTNEVTINWNAPMVYLLGALTHIASQ